MLLSREEIIFLITIVASTFFVLFIFFITVIVLNVKMRKQKETEKLNAVIATQESERKRIAEDMHDEMGPMLSAIKLQINNFIPFDNSAELEKNIRETSGHLDTVIQSIRSTVRNLTPPYVSSEDWMKGIEEFRAVIEKQNRIKFNFTKQITENRFTEVAKTTIYRIIHEMINNSLKHSNCNRINLSVEQNKEDLSIVYNDNGTLQHTSSGSDTGTGIRNIESRVNALNGKMERNSDFRQGTYYRVQFKNKNILSQ